MLQQHCRLLLKCKLLKLEGSYQRTHSLRDLLRRLENYPDEVGKATVSEENYLQLACFHLVLGKCTQLQEELGVPAAGREYGCMDPPHLLVTFAPSDLTKNDAPLDEKWQEL